jgi:peptidoglycan/LPS O-acetylase OafA/YrhL
LNGYLAVTLFFMLSGFILAYNYCGQIETKNHAYRFWEARSVRIWPPYLFASFFQFSALSRPLTSARHDHHFSGSIHRPLPSRVRGALELCLLEPFARSILLSFCPILQTSIEKLCRAHLLLFGAFIFVFFALPISPLKWDVALYGPLSCIPGPLIHLPTFTSEFSWQPLASRHQALDWP